MAEATVLRSRNSERIESAQRRTAALKQAEELVGKIYAVAAAARSHIDDQDAKLLFDVIDDIAAELLDTMSSLADLPQHERESRHG